MNSAATIDLGLLISLCLKNSNVRDILSQCKQPSGHVPKFLLSRIICMCHCYAATILLQLFVSMHIQSASPAQRMIIPEITTCILLVEMSDQFISYKCYHYEDPDDLNWSSQSGDTSKTPLTLILY